MDRTLTTYSQATIREALRMAQVAHDRIDELHGIDRVGIAQAIGILDQLDRRCHGGRFAGMVDAAEAELIRPLVQAAAQARRVQAVRCSEGRAPHQAKESRETHVHPGQYWRPALRTQNRER